MCLKIMVENLLAVRVIRPKHLNSIHLLYVRFHIFMGFQILKSEVPFLLGQVSY